MRRSPVTHRRWLIWLPLLCTSAYLALQDLPAEDVPDVVHPVERSEPSLIDPNGTRSSSTLALLKLVPRGQLMAVPSGATDASSSSSDLFERRSWSPPRPPAPPPPKVAPTAPPLPFTFLGKKFQDGQWEIFLGNGDFTYVVREGLTFAAAYQVQSIQPPIMTLVYLPLNQPQTLAIGSGL